MIYQIYYPTSALADIVEHYWYSKIEMSAAAIQHYPTPLLQGLAFNFFKHKEHHAYDDKVITLSKQAYFFGQPTCPRVITTNEKGVDIIGVKFKPLGIARLTGINMEHMADRIIAAEDIWGNELELLCDEMQSTPALDQTIKVLESFLLNKYQRSRQHYQAEKVSNALSLIEVARGDIQIKEIQHQTHTSRKTLERHFVNYLGLKPKLYTQIVRFNAAKDFIDKNLAKPNLAILAYDFGYWDGSHFSADFKRFAGLSPKEYLLNKSIGG